MAEVSGAYVWKALSFEPRADSLVVITKQGRARRLSPLAMLRNATFTPLANGPDSCECPSTTESPTPHG